MLNSLQKAVTKTRLRSKIPREDATLVQGIRTPAAVDTTSELTVGNGCSGAPVTASMSDGFCRNQGGTVDYFVSHPWFFRGGYFYIFPNN